MPRLIEASAGGPCKRREWAFGSGRIGRVGVAAMFAARKARVPYVCPIGNDILFHRHLT